ncbi:MAG: hypothetical protein KDA95_12050, partial [Acidimicrobiales bacterium]|nr:hypothetical protein [Acidimicrobiales bacterium]
MRRLPVLGAALITFAVVIGLVGPAWAQEPAESTDHGRVSILKVEGLIDPVMADFISRSITEGERAGVVAVVLQLDSAQATIDDGRLVQLATQIHNSEVPVAVWVGPSGSSARGRTAQLVGAAELVGIAPGARLGKTGELVVPERLLSPAFVAASQRLKTSTVNAEEAYKLKITQSEQAPVIGEFLIDIPGFQSEQVKQGNRTVTQPLTTPVFSSLDIQAQLFHTVSSPAAAYLLLVIGLSLILFEFFTAGVGIAGLVGAGCFLLASYGLATLPVRYWALALIGFAMFGFGVDVQIGVPRAWSVIASISLIIGSVWLYDGFDQSWITLLVGIGGVISAMVLGMPIMVRTRFSTPAIDREWLIGERGEAV